MSRLKSKFPVLFKADLTFKDFSRKLSKFKYFSSLCEPCTIYPFEINTVTVDESGDNHFLLKRKLSSNMLSKIMYTVLLMHGCKTDFLTVTVT